MGCIGLCERPGAGMYQVLLVETRRTQAAQITQAMSGHGITTTLAKTFRTARQRLTGSRHDAMVVSQAAANGQLGAFCADICRDDPSLAVIARLADYDPGLEERLFDAGVTDVAVDAVPARALARRIEVRLRDRSKAWPRDGLVRLGDAAVDCQGLQVWVRGQLLPISKRMAMLVEYLVKNRRRPISRKEAAEKVWADAAIDPNGKNLDMLVMRLRRLVEPNPRKPSVIRAVWGTGYMLI